MTTPEISVIIPTLNSPYLAQTISALLNQTYNLEKVEIIVVGMDKYNQIPAHETIRFIATNKPTSVAKVRNMGLWQARGRIVCFTDDDCVPTSTWLEKIVLPYHQSSSIFIVGGAMPLPETGYWSQCDAVASAYEHLTFQPAGLRRQLPSLNFSAYRDILLAIRGFDETFPKPAGEDSYLSARLRQVGYSLYFTPHAIVEHIGWRKSSLTVLSHAYLFGKYSIWLNEDVRPVTKPPLFFTHWFLMCLVFPFLAFWITIRYLRHSAMWSYWFLLPSLYCIQIAWGFGVIQTLRQRTD